MRPYLLLLISSFCYHVSHMTTFTEGDEGSKVISRIVFSQCVRVCISVYVCVCV